MKATQWLALSIAILSCGLVAAQARQIDQVEQILCEREVGNGNGKTGLGSIANAVSVTLRPLLLFFAASFALLRDLRG